MTDSWKKRLEMILIFFIILRRLYKLFTYDKNIRGYGKKTFRSFFTVFFRDSDFMLKFAFDILIV
jgi:hypothetical protein